MKLEVGDIDGEKLGMVPLASPYKASLIFAPSFKKLVVIPCRDFIYVMAEHSTLVGKVGEVVVREFRESGYPITRIESGPS